MSSRATQTSRLAAVARAPLRIRSATSIGDRVLFCICALAGLVVVAVLIEIAYQVISGASLSTSRFGLSFLFDAQWQPNFGRFGAAAMLYGTAVSSLLGLVLAAPLGVVIELVLDLMQGLPTVVVGLFVLRP